MQTLEILEKLVAFPTVSSEPNRALIDWCADLLRRAGARVTIVASPDGNKANLFASIGPEDHGGVMLSGHTDVVPVDGQDWSRPAFELGKADGKLFGRGTADMKGFVASALSLALRAARSELATPLHLALSHDEEIGCVGVRSLLDVLAEAPVRPRFCIVGEPTMLAVATAHKGKTAFEVVCRGHEAHSALAPDGLNAMYLATDMIAAIRALQEEVRAASPSESTHDVPWTTLHVGRIEGGIALNIVPRETRFLAEIRNIASDDPGRLVAKLQDAAREIVAPHLARFPDAAIDLNITNTYPSLDTSADSEVVRFVQSLSGANGTSSVAFGTEGGLFDSVLGVPTVICGPGSMAQGHKPDEYITLDQIRRCDVMLDTLLERLIKGLG